MLASMSRPKDRTFSTVAAATNALISLKEEPTTTTTNNNNIVNLNNVSYTRTEEKEEDRSRPDFLLEMVPTGKAKNNAKTAHQPLKLFNGSYVLKKELDLCVFVNATAFRHHYATLSFELTFPDRRVCASFQDGNLLMCRKVDPELNHFHIRLLPKYTVSGKGTRGANNRHNHTVLSVFGDRTLLYSIHFGIYHKSTRVGTNEPDLLRFFRVFVPPSAPDATPSLSPMPSGVSSGKTLPVMAYFLEKSSLAAPIAATPIALPCANLSEIKRFEVMEPPSPSPSPCYSSASSAPSPLPSPSFFYHQQYVQYMQTKTSPKASPPDSPSSSTDSGSHSHSRCSGSSSGSSSPSYGAPTPVAQSPNLATGSPLLLPPATPPPSHFYAAQYRPVPISPLYPPLYSPAPSPAPAPAEYYHPYPPQQHQQYGSVPPPVISVMTVGTGAGGDNSVSASSVVHHHYHYYPSPSAVLSPSFAPSPSTANPLAPSPAIGGVNGGYYDLPSSTRSNNGGQTPIYSLLNKGAPSPCPSSSSQSVSNVQSQTQSQSQSPLSSPQQESSNGSSTGSTSGSCAGNNVSFHQGGSFAAAPSPSPSAAPSPSPYSFYHYPPLSLCPSPLPFGFVNASPQLYNFHNGGQTPLFPTPGTPAPFADPDYFEMLLSAASSASASAPSISNSCPSSASVSSNPNGNNNANNDGGEDDENSNEVSSLPHSLDVPSSELQTGSSSPSSSMTDDGHENDHMAGSTLPRDSYILNDQDAEDAEHDLWSSDSSASAFMEEHHNVFGGHDDDHHHPLSPHFPS